jgi:hypothetical protein
MPNKEVEELAEIMDKFRFTQCPDCSNPTSDCWECQARYLINADYHKVEPVQLVSEERNRIHIEINKMLEPLKLHLCWITSADIASEQYGLADEDGDDIDIGVIEVAMNEYHKRMDINE